VVKIILIKSPDEWATTKQACRDELAVYLCFSFHIIYFALLWCIEHCSTKIKFYTLYIYIYHVNFTYQTTWILTLCLFTISFNLTASLGSISGVINTCGSANNLACKVNIVKFSNLWFSPHQQSNVLFSFQ